MNKARRLGVFGLILGLGLTIWQVASFVGSGSFSVYWLFFVIPVPIVLVGIMAAIGGIMLLVSGKLPEPKTY